MTDIFLALYPISIASNLQTSMRVKVGFCLLMMVGIVPGIASFIRFGLLHTIYNAKDFTCKSWCLYIASVLIIVQTPKVYSTSGLQWKSAPWSFLVASRLYDHSSYV